MLYDPKWNEATNKPDVLSLEGLVAWLEKQNPRKRYDYMNCDGKCLYGQYMAAYGISWDESGASESSSKPRGAFCSLVYEVCAGEAPYTFGSALKRLRAHLADR